MNKAVQIIVLTLRIIAIFFMLAGAELLIRQDEAASDTAGFMFAGAGAALAMYSRSLAAKVDRARLHETRFEGNLVLDRIMSMRTGLLGLSGLIAGGFLFLMSAAILRLGIYSLVLIGGFALMGLAFIWLIGLTVFAAVKVFQELSR